jgi:hypothetical protein
MCPTRIGSKNVKGIRVDAQRFGEFDLRLLEIAAQGVGIAERLASGWGWSWSADMRTF